MGGGCNGLQRRRFIFPVGSFDFQEDFQSKPYLQGFRYMNDMEKLAEGRIVIENFHISDFRFPFGKLSLA
jgi:hypothetical protein